MTSAPVRDPPALDPVRHWRLGAPRASPLSGHVPPVG